MLEIDCDLKRLYYLNHSTHGPWHWAFIIAYITLTLLSIVSNSSLLLALNRYNERKRRQQNPLATPNFLVRPMKPCELTTNLLISHLAIADLLLSLTIPFTAVDGLSKFWPLGGNSELLCKITKS